jgi:hypothetical protein
MKKLLTMLVASLGIMVIMPAAALAATGTTYVTGTVTNGGSPVVGANVSVVCNGNTMTSSTTNGGGYIVQFSATDCPNGKTAVVTATKGGLNGSNSGPVDDLTADINLAIVNVSVPEFGIAAGVVALAAGAGSLVVVRRRHANANS